MTTAYNPLWNPHYDFANPQNLAEIEKRARYSKAFHTVYGPGVDPAGQGYKEATAFLLECERKELGGRDGYDFGVVVQKDWGSNEVLSFRHENGVDTCIKKIVVKPNNMLSLQSHEGRQEEWQVTEGVLTLISNGALYEVSDNGVYDVTDGRHDKITDPAIAFQKDGHWAMVLPKGSIHCMINRGDRTVTVIETQTGITREADNNRYVDQLRGQAQGRAIIPLTSELHYRSAQLYWQVEAEIAAKPGVGWNVSYCPAQKQA